VLGEVGLPTGGRRTKALIRATRPAPSGRGSRGGFSASAPGGQEGESEEEGEEGDPHIQSDASICKFEASKREPCRRRTTTSSYWGAGTAGITAALAAAHEGARVGLVERTAHLGGDCTYTGCVPSKALVETAKLAYEIRRAADEGILEQAPELDFARVMARRARIVADIARDERDERCTDRGIAVIHGDGRFVARGELAVGERRLRFERAVIATGTRPLVPPDLGLDDVPYLTNETIFTLERLPRRLICLGGGPTALELAQSFRRFGSEVVIVEQMEGLLPLEEPEAGELAAKVLADEGIELQLAERATRAQRREAGVVLQLASGHEEAGDALLVAAGRKADTDRLGLDVLGVRVRNAFVETDEQCRTSAEHVFAAGDVTGGFLFTHVAAQEGRVAGLNAAGKREKVDLRVVPWVTFLDPEIARVGLTEAEARASRRGVETVVFPMERVDRARIAGRPQGFVKLVTASRPLLGRAGGGELVGAQIAGPRAGELIQECALAMQIRSFAGRLAQTIHAYPSVSTGVQQAAAQLFSLGRVLAEEEQP
jgi:pyruvate/2-oxoglutarate dehydrogenase complex dihydrolipoamide dehydrogenase (E3) component